MRTFVDTSVIFAAANEGDFDSGRARDILTGEPALIASDHVLLEAWRLARGWRGWHAAESLWRGLLASPIEIAPVLGHDLDAALEIGRAWEDQQFSLVDRTSFALMERLGITRVASFDEHFAVYRFGPRRNRAFELVS